MGMINTKSKFNNISNTSAMKSNYRFPTTSHSRSLLTSCHQKTNYINFQEFYNKERLCMKKKVLILGLDGVGKTDLFTRLIRHNKQPATINSLPRPTIGKCLVLKKRLNGFCF
jgi:hypothetical protein